MGSPVGGDVRVFIVDGVRGHAAIGLLSQNCALYFIRPYGDHKIGRADNNDTGALRTSGA